MENDKEHLRHIGLTPINKLPEEDRTLALHKERIAASINILNVTKDEVAKILEELREESILSVIDTLEVNDNIFNAKVMFCDDFRNRQIVCNYQITINKIILKGEVGSGLLDLQFMAGGKKDFMTSIIDHISKQIATTIISDAFIQPFMECMYQSDIG